MDSSQWLALSIFVSYFGLILVLFYVILARSILWRSASSAGLRKWVFVVLTGASFAHTWYYMWSFSNYESSLLFSPKEPLLARIANWLSNTGLFEEAWAAVCRGPLNWWWSEQLCLFTAGTWTVFLAVEGRNRSIKHLWAYMLLGQVVAISVASNLFYLALVMSGPPRMQLKMQYLSPSVWLSVLLSIVTIVLSPYTSEKTFLPNLLVMHAFLIIPLLPMRSTSQLGALSIIPGVLYPIIGLLSGFTRVPTIMAAANASLPAGAKENIPPASALWTTLHSHPAQSSIGWDIVWTSISFLVWFFVNMKFKSSISGRIAIGLIAVGLTGYLSVCMVAPILLGVRYWAGFEEEELVVREASRKGE